MQVFLIRKTIRWSSIYTSIMLLMLMLLLTGCGAKDIDKRMFVIAVGIDKNEDDEDNPYKVTLKIPIPTNNKASKSPQFLYLTQASFTISEALEKLTSHVDKNLEYSHCKFIVFGENIIEEDLRIVMDVFLRRRDFQQTSWIAVSRPSADSVMRATFQGDTPDVNILFDRFSKIGTESTFIVTRFLFDFRRQLGEAGIDPVLPIIEINKDKSSMVINKSIVISSDPKKNLEFTPDQTEIYNLLTNQLKELYFHIPVEIAQSPFSVFADHIVTSYNIITTNQERPVIKMNVNLSGVIEESTKQVVPADLDTYNQLTSEAVKDRIESLLKLLQQNNMDPIGFGLRYEATRWHNRDLAAEWQQLYPDIEFQVTANVTIKSLGVIQ